MIGLLIIASILFSACLAYYGWILLRYIDFVTDAAGDIETLQMTKRAMEGLWGLFQFLLVSAVIGQFFSIGAMFLLPTLGGWLLSICIVFFSGVLIIFHRSYLRGRMSLFC